MGKTKYLNAIGLGIVTVCLIPRTQGQCPPSGCEDCECPEECCAGCPNYCPCPGECPCQPTCCGTGDCSGDRWCPIAPVAGAGSDLTIGDITDYCAWGSSGSGSSGIAAFSVGNVNCNSGTQVLHWNVPMNKRAVMGQNMYRLTEDDANKDYRFEQIGMAWIKHSFSAVHGPLPECTAGSAYGVCCGLVGNDYLGIGCGDTYDATMNGTTSLGPKSAPNPDTGENGVNAVTGFVPARYPATCTQSEEDRTCKRIQVKHDDLDATFNPPSVTKYYVEQQWVTLDEATEPAMRNNNPTYREIVVGGGFCCGTSCEYTIDDAPASVAQPGTAAIYSWLEVPDVMIIEKDVDEGAGQTGRVILAAKATDLGNGLWAYEYALYNMNSHTSIESFSVPKHSTTAVSSPGFHGVPYHSGEEDLIDTSDWTNTIASTSIKWDAPGPPPDPPPGWEKNALRWGTLYNFRFQADAAPATNDGNIRLGL